MGGRGLGAGVLGEVQRADHVLHPALVLAAVAAAPADEADRQLRGLEHRALAAEEHHGAARQLVLPQVRQVLSGQIIKQGGG